MAKKVTKKTAKKVSKPAKKVAKKPAAKKVAKPAKKAKKVLAKKSAPKKAAKPAKKIKAKKSVAKAPAKKAVKKITKPIAKKASKPVVAEKKEVKKPVPVQVAQKPAAKPSIVKPIAKKPVKQKNESNIDMDEDSESGRNEESSFIPAKQPVIHKPNKLNPIVPKPQINKDTRSRYSDAELLEFKELILKKLEEAKHDFELLKSTLSHKDDHGTDDTSPTFKLLEDGSDVMSKEETAHLAARQEKFIQNLQNALIRIENKTYGICRATGKLISKERLRSVPHATLSIDAKLEQASS